MNTIIKQKIDNFSRLIIVKYFSRQLSLYIVNEYPKSGGTWLGSMLSDILFVPFPRNCFPDLKTSIVHGHFEYSSTMNKVIVIWRDGRDVMVSWYHHCLFKNERMNGKIVDRVRKDLNLKDIDDVKNNLPKFIEYSFSSQKTPRFSWSEFVDQWYNRPDVIYTSYEKLIIDAESELLRILKLLEPNFNTSFDILKIVEKYSFAKQSGRIPGSEKKNSFMRKGVAGDWVNFFNKHSCDIFKHYAGKQLIKLGYEKDFNWTNL